MKKNNLYAFFVIILIFLIIFKTLFLVVKVHSNSMLSTLKQDDYALLFKTKLIQKNDKVVFEIGRNKYLKRCIAMPSDTLSIDSLGILTINNKFQKENYTYDKQKYINIFTENKHFFMNEYVVPFKGFTIKLDSISYKIYSHLINRLESQELKHNNGKYFMGKKEKKVYKFKDDCFFFLGDNRKISIDSRYYGAIPRKFIRGKLICY